MRKKVYDGYRSFQYLESGVDYKPFELSKEIGRVEPYIYPVSAGRRSAYSVCWRR